MALSVITNASSMNEFAGPLQNGLVSRQVNIRFVSESTLHSPNIVCFSKFHHTPAVLLWGECHLALYCLLAAAGKFKVYRVNVSEVPYMYL
jgi:hypothetical protein